ncbi:MAG: divergent polysaccharide deacetylase family protein, partial [Desulfobacteraceae bacterium]|nr:divergent polysaccharide deacetylase family protein [Desulfobacteraceae bacterium]
GIIILVFIVATLAMVADFFINQRSDKKIDKKSSQSETAKVKTKKPLLKSKTESEQKKPEEKETTRKIKYEVFDDDTSSVPSKIHVKDPVKVKPVIKKNGLPLVAIIIDDIGYHRRNARTIARLDTNITFAVLPFSPHGEELANELHDMGNQIMLHLPMEPVEYPSVDSGPGSLLSDMNPDELIFQLKKNLDSIPYVVGVNNHMGSKLTPMSEKMNQIFTILKKRNLFFIDSITTGRTKCASSASLLKISFGQRDIFIDNIQESEYIIGQIRQLIRKAEKNGSAIGIAHPYGATAETLKKNLPWIKKRVQLVPALILTAKLSG